MPLHLGPIWRVGLIFITNPGGQWLLCLFEHFKHAKGSHIKWQPDVIFSAVRTSGNGFEVLGIVILAIPSMGKAFYKGFQVAIN